MSEPVDFTNEWEFSDVIFQFDDGIKVYANKMTLCQWSPVLKVMLTTEIQNELQCYSHQFFYLNRYDRDENFHIRECNFENSTGTNPGGDTWSHSNRCDYCLCQKLKNLLRYCFMAQYRPSIQI